MPPLQLYHRLGNKIGLFAQVNKTITILEPADQQAGDIPKHESKYRDITSLVKKNALDGKIGECIGRDGEILPIVQGSPRDTKLNPLGARGIGEIGLAGMAAAIANAVHHATGVRMRELPIKIEHLLG